MKKFRFSLGRLQRLRRHEEKAARRVLAECLSIVRALEREQVTIVDNIAACEAEQGAARGLGRAMVQGLQSAWRRNETQLTVARENSEAARVAHLERRRAAETLARLHERGLEAWRTEVIREEQAELDEIARMRFAQAQVEEES